VFNYYNLSVPARSRTLPVKHALEVNLLFHHPACITCRQRFNGLLADTFMVFVNGTFDDVVQGSLVVPTGDA
jgi:hypothetical protein